MADECIFCKIIRKEVPSKLAYEDKDYYAFHDINPAAPSHVLIIPRKHIGTLNDIHEDDQTLVGGMISLAAKIAAEMGFAEDGYRTVFNCNADGGQTVFHIHLHLLGGRRLKWPPG